MSRWSDFYRDRIGDKYADYCEERYKPFISVLRDYGPSYREEGCGIGTIAKILSKDPGVVVDLVDNDHDILILAYTNLSLSPQYKGIASHKLWCPQNFFETDIRTGRCSQPRDTIYSHGVLEHFSDEDIHDILNRQCSIAKTVVHYVPTDGYDIPSFGDERLLSIQYWNAKFKPIYSIPFNDNKDLILIFKGER